MEEEVYINSNYLVIGELFFYFIFDSSVELKVSWLIPISFEVARAIPLLPKVSTAL